jgi:hypothetical protein
MKQENKLTVLGYIVMVLMVFVLVLSLIDMQNNNKPSYYFTDIHTYYGPKNNYQPQSMEEKYIPRGTVIYNKGGTTK